MYTEEIFSTSIISDASKALWGRVATLSRIPVGPWRIAARSPVLGAAYTMRLSVAVPSTGLGLDDWLVAVDEAKSDTIVVIETIGELGEALGEAGAERLHARRVRGVVVDGRVRDYAGIVACGLPSWVRGVGIAGMPMDQLRVDTNVEVRCGGVLVAPDDLVVGDEDGLIVIPASEAAAVLAAAREVAARESRMFQLIADGLPISQAYQRTNAK